MIGTKTVYAIVIQFEESVTGLGVYSSIEKAREAIAEFTDKDEHFYYEDDAQTYGVIAPNDPEITWCDCYFQIVNLYEDGSICTEF